VTGIRKKVYLVLQRIEKDAQAEAAMTVITGRRIKSDKAPPMVRP
jgi:hypothetical protein